MLYMEPMTPEERFTQIENAIQALIEIQSQHEAQIEKQNAGIRDLVLVSRTLLDSQKEVTKQIQEFREAQRELTEKQKTTEEKLHALIETVDRIIRNWKS